MTESGPHGLIHRNRETGLCVAHLEAKPALHNAIYSLLFIPLFENIHGSPWSGVAAWLQGAGRDLAGTSHTRGDEHHVTSLRHSEAHRPHGFRTRACHVGETAL